MARTNDSANQPRAIFSLCQKQPASLIILRLMHALRLFACLGQVVDGTKGDEISKVKNGNHADFSTTRSGCGHYQGGSHKIIRTAQDRVLTYVAQSFHFRPAPCCPTSLSAWRHSNIYCSARATVRLIYIRVIYSNMGLAMMTLQMLSHAEVISSLHS